MAVEADMRGKASYQGFARIRSQHFVLESYEPAADLTDTGPDCNPLVVAGWDQVACSDFAHC